jgi:hypothetical protein
MELCIGIAGGRGGSDGAECMPAKKRRVDVVTLATTAGGCGIDENERDGF